MLTTKEAQALVEEARRRGARGAEVLVSNAEGVEIEVGKGKVQKTTPRAESSITIRCWAEGGGMGVARSEALDSGSTLIDQALARSKKRKADPNGGPVQRLSQPGGGLGIDDRRHPQLTMADRIEVVTSAEKGARMRDKRARTDGFAYWDRRTQRVFANSRGLALDEWSTEYHAKGTVAVADESDEITLSEHLAGRAFATIASLPFGSSLAERAAELLGPAVPVEGPIRVLLAPRVVAGLFARIGELFAHDDVIAGRGFLAAAQKKLDIPDPDELRPTIKSLVDPRLHLLDDGTVPGSLGTRMFDDRGVVPVPLTLIREGRVDARWLDPETARSLDVRPTGHTRGDALAPSNLILRGGSRSANAILTEIPDPVLAVDEIADWKRFDIDTGRLDVPIWGHLTRKSQRIGTVRGVRLTGNLLHVFANLFDVASDTDRFLHVDAPAIIVDGFVVKPA